MPGYVRECVIFSCVDCCYGSNQILIVGDLKFMGSYGFDRRRKLLRVLDLNDCFFIEVWKKCQMLTATG